MRKGWVMVEGKCAEPEGIGISREANL